MNTGDFIDRLLKCRPLTFYTSADIYLLKDGKHGFGWKEGEWSETFPFEKYLSYEELPISALIGQSSFTHFINDGSRDNEGIKGIPGSFEPSGVYIGWLALDLK